MKIPLLWMAAGFASGILLTPFCEIPLYGLIALELFLLPFLWKSRGRVLFFVLFSFSMLVTGVFYAKLDRQRPPHAVEKKAAGEWGFLEGRVGTPPEVRTKGRKRTVSFVLHAESWKPFARERQRKSLRAVRHNASIQPVSGDVQVFLFQPTEIPPFGSRVRLKGILKKPDPVLNPGEFDYGRYLRQRGIFALFQGFGPKCIVFSKPGRVSLFPHLIETLRTALEARIDELFRGEQASETSAFLKALILGKRKEIDYETREAFLKTGTSHLLAISGLHVSLVAGSFYLFLILMRLPQKVAAVITIVMISVYVGIAGVGIPVVRAGWMMGMAFVAVTLEREHHALNLFLLAFLVLLVSDTRLIGNLSFQLSFLSVFCLIVLVPRLPASRFWVMMLGRTLVVLMGTFPVVIYYFNVFSLSSLVANLVAIPLFYFSLMGAFASLLFGWIAGIGEILKLLTEGSLNAALVWIRFLARQPWGFWYVPTPSWPQFLFYYTTVAAWAFLPRTRRLLKWMRTVAWGLFLVAGSSFFWPVSSSGQTVTLLAAGKNEMAHLRIDRSTHWLINTGRRYPSLQAQWIVSPYLRQKGVKTIRGVVLTDGYARHRGGLAYLRKNFNLRTLWVAESAYRRLEPEIRKTFDIEILHGGQEVQFEDKLRMRFLEAGEGRLNVVLFWAQGAFLFLSQLTRQSICALREDPEVLRRVKVLVLPSFRHHQLPSSSLIEEFFELFGRVIVILPHRESLFEHLLAVKDLPLFILADGGAITFKQEDQDISMHSMTDETLWLSTLLSGETVSVSHVDKDFRRMV